MASMFAHLRTLLAVLFNRPLRVRFGRAGEGHFFPLQRTVLPVIAGADDAPGGDDGDGDGDEDGDKPDGDNKPDGDDGDGEEDPVKPEDDWQTKSRKNERRAKREKEQREKAEKELAEERSKSKSEAEKAVEKAKEEGRTEAQTEAEKERRADRLEVAVTRLAAKGVEVGEGDDAETVRFADAEDALVNIERAIRNGDIDAEDIFDDEGKVKADALADELRSLLKRKPHLRAGAEGRKTGDPDTRKGDRGSTDLDAMSVDDHISRKYGEKK